MQVSPLDKVHYTEEIKHELPKAIADDQAKLEKVVAKAQKKGI
jgi:hypothetical protein